MNKYKKYLIAVAILVLGIVIGKISSGDGSKPADKTGIHEHSANQEVWTCSMHPQIRMDKQGTCPLCGMDLILVDESNHSGSEVADNEIVFTQEAIQLANIQTTIVSRSDAVKNVRLLGTVKPDERRQYSQVSHLPGRIERLYVNFTGEKIQKGQKIVRLYSPELISAQKELFEAIKSKDVYPQLYKASRNKLKLWKLSDYQIDAIVASGEVQEQIDILSDYSGYVMKRNIELGDHVMTGMKIFDIANIDMVWVMFEAYETDIAWIEKGDMVEFNVQAVPGKQFRGKVTYMDPFVSSETRVAKIRVEIANKNHKLLPEMYANGVIKSNLTAAGNALIIPKSAVLWTGKRGVVYIKVPHDNTISFIYREVVLGADLGDFYIVVSGIEEGEEVATNGVFRIDASAQLLGQKSMMNPEPLNGQTNIEQANDNDIEFDASGIDLKFKEQLSEVVQAYIQLKNALVNDDEIAAKKYALITKSKLTGVDMKLVIGEAHEHWMGHLNSLNKYLEEVDSGKNMEAQRQAFGKLSRTLSEVINNFGWVSLEGEKLYLEYCPMVNNNKGGYWLSNEKEISNPFFGEKMMRCGEVIKSF